MTKKNGQNLVTTVSLDFDDIIIGLMFNLLRTHHPVKRVKVNKRFKRAVELNGRTYILPKDKTILFSTLFRELETLYDSEYDEIMHVLSSFYKF